ncbi:MAG TPA: cysteine dioxygenase [Streptosporangiaceae bacterium]|nr:cysteine dioxygenase [Streptosporangiaceae bacterium]
MNPDVSTAPEVAQLAWIPASAPPFGSTGAATGRLTAGRLAALVRAAAADPARWWHLVRFDPRSPVHLRLEALPGCEVWLVTTPPGYRGSWHDHGPRCEALTVVAGELAERTITAAGAADRPLLPNRVRVRGRAHLHETVNPGTCYAISLCAHATAAAPAALSG